MTENLNAGTGSGPADIIIENAHVATLAAGRPRARAIAITGTTIVAVGDAKEVEAFRGPRTRRIDAGGRTVIPGLTDAHTHFIRTGLNYSLEVRWDGVPSLGQALEMLRQQARSTPPPNWVQVVGGWSAYQFAERRMPTLEEINQATGETPTYVLHLYDRCLLNRAALRALGFTRETEDPFGGYLERDGQGNPTGLIVSTTSLAGVVFLQRMIPKLSVEDQHHSTRHFMRELNRLGVTSVVDAGGAGQSYPDDYRVILDLAERSELTVRIGYSLFCQHPGGEIDDYRSWIDRVAPGTGDDYLRMSGGGEYLVWSAADPANFAKEYIPQPEIMETQLAEVVRLIVSQGWSFRLHATYDESARRILGVLEEVNRELPLEGLRWTIDHAETISPRSLERVAAMGGAISIQNRMSLDGEAFVQRLGAAVAEDAPPIARIREAGIPLSAGTDGTRCTSYNPWVGVHWLLTGRTAGGLKHQADRNLLDREEALRLYTTGGSWFTREEERKGTIEPGKLADLAVLSADYFSIPDNEVPALESLLTLVGGEVVHASGPFAAMAPPSPPVSPGWAPIGTWPGYARPTAGAELPSGKPHATAGQAQPAGHGHQRIVGVDGFVWELGCGCAWA